MNEETIRHLADLLPVLRELNRATQRLAASLPGPAHPVAGSGSTGDEVPSVDIALAEVNAAIDAYCEVSVAHSGLGD